MKKNQKLKLQLQVLWYERKKNVGRLEAIYSLMEESVLVC
jgi:hypothetical protein